jgi:hypothetical protein
MQMVTGVFSSAAEAWSAFDALRSSGIPEGKLTLLSSADAPKDVADVPVNASEQPGMGKAIGALVGGVGGLSGGSLLMAAFLPGVGPITVAGLLGAAIVGAAGAGVGAAAGASLENAMTDGLPEDEIFIYEDALRRGCTVLIAASEDSSNVDQIGELLKSHGAETVDDARQQWWIGLRSAEQEHYSGTESGQNLADDEKFFRLGFEAALHAMNRCRGFDAASAEMSSKLEDLQRQYPDAQIERLFTRGYLRGREYYQRLCDQEKAA